MGRVQDVLVVTGNYPTAGEPTSGTFVRAFANAMADSGARVRVVHPVSVFARRRGPYPKGGWDLTPAGNRVEIFRPVFASFSVVNLGLMNTVQMTQAGFEAAVVRVVHRLTPRPTVVCGHFLYLAGRAAVRVGRDLGVPSFVTVGEGRFWSVEPVGFERARRDFSGVTGLVAVSTPIKEGLEKRLGVPAEKIAVFPNGVDRRVFRPRDRSECRKLLGLPMERTLVAFVGTFNTDKGGEVLLEAVRGIPDLGVILLGSGPLRMESPEVVFRGRVSHGDLPRWLAAADLFVLPSLVEGSCNAVVEAMAMGLPIITSRADYMDDLVDDEVAIRIDPRDVRAVRAAIEALVVDPALRAKMGEAALRRASELDILKRARSVLEWMDSRAGSIGLPRAAGEPLATGD